MTPPDKIESGSKLESVDKHPGYDNALGLCNKIFVALKKDLDPKKVVVIQNPKAKALLDAAKEIEIEKIKEIKENPEKDEVTITFSDSGKSLEFKKGEDIYEAIFWTPPESKDTVTGRTKDDLGERGEATAKTVAAAPKPDGHAEDVAGELTKTNEYTTKIAIPAKSTIFLGDSITVGMKDDLAIQENNHLVKGATSARTMARDFPGYIEANQERIKSGELEQVVVLAGYNDICNLQQKDSGFSHKSVEEKAERIFKNLEKIYKIAQSQEPPLRVIACTLTYSPFPDKPHKYSEKDGRTGQQVMREVYAALNDKIRAYPGVTVIDLAKETTENKEKYPLRDTVHHTTKGSRNLAQFIQGLSVGSENISPETDIGQIHKDYDALLQSEAIKSRQTADREKAGKTTVRGVRFNHRLLVPIEGVEEKESRIKNLKEETARRIAVYSNPGNNDWHALNYTDIGGHEHLYGIGLGDILLDPDIQEIWVEKNGKVLKGTRGKTSSGRNAFLDENGKYIATYDGDKFKIITEKKLTPEKYIQTLDKEIGERKENKEVYRSDREVKLSQSLNWKEDAGKYKPTTEEYAIRRLNSAREENDGEAILNYAKEVCSKFGIPWLIYKELVMVESAWDPRVQYNGHIASDAAGLGQFLSGTWRGFMKNECKGKVLDSRWGSPEGSPIEQKHKFNPYANAYATAWLLSKTKKRMASYLEGKKEYEQGFIYYLAHNRGVGGAKSYLRFMGQMEEEGFTTRGQIERSYNEDPSKYSGTLIGAHRRYIANYGIQTFLNAYFRHSKKVGLRVLAAKPEELERVKKDNPRENRENTAYTKNSIAHRKIHPEKGYTSEYFDLKNGQERWLIGSSTAVGMEHSRDMKTGIFGISGINAKSGTFLSRFKKEIGEHLIKNPSFKPPKEIVILGLAVNGALPDSKIKSDDHLDRSVEKSVQAYKDIINYFKNEEPFKGHNIKVKVATVQPYQSRIRAITKFNKRIKEELTTEQVIHLASNISTSDNQWKPGMVARDNLHLSKKGQGVLNDLIQGSA
jgi:lysophospholipase L1-like esterase